MWIKSSPITLISFVIGFVCFVFCLLNSASADERYTLTKEKLSASLFMPVFTLEYKDGYARNFPAEIKEKAIRFHGDIKRYVSIIEPKILITYHTQDGRHNLGNGRFSTKMREDKVPFWFDSTSDYESLCRMFGYMPVLEGKYEFEREPHPKVGYFNYKPFVKYYNNHGYAPGAFPTTESMSNRPKIFYFNGVNGPSGMYYSGFSNKSHSDGYSKILELVCTDEKGLDSYRHIMSNQLDKLPTAFSILSNATLPKVSEYFRQLQVFFAEGDLLKNPSIVNLVLNASSIVLRGNDSNIVTENYLGPLEKATKTSNESMSSSAEGLEMINSDYFRASAFLFLKAIEVNLDLIQSQPNATEIVARLQAFLAGTIESSGSELVAILNDATPLKSALSEHENSVGSEDQFSDFGQSLLYLETKVQTGGDNEY